MNRDRQQAIDYLRAPANGLWRWAENGAVLVWRDGSTIAFREEIVQILEWLAPNDLPSFGAITFLLAACRGKLPSVSDIVTLSNTPLPSVMGKEAMVLTTARKQLHAQLTAALAELAKVGGLPAALNSGIKARCVLAEAVFEPAKVERYVEARAVLRGLREPMNDSELTDTGQAGVRGSYHRQIHLVAEGLKPHTAESLALRLRTGLDALPQDPAVNLPAAERARRLVEDLSRDRELGALARATREFMAAVRLPRRLGEREQPACGGVADITNRGPLDRLLSSELAHDDLTLSVRIALNEALYLRREPPMREPPGTLALLLDSGVRLWGVPRLLAAAVALALIARDKQHNEVLAWRAHGKQLQPLDLLTRSGLAEHLGVLEPAAHAGESVPAFAAAVSTDARNQSVLITQPDALADPDFRRALADNPGAPGFVATVNRDGRFELHRLPLAHRPPLCEAHVDLAAVFDQPGGVPLIRTEVDPNLPAIFGVSPFPFLLPVAGQVDCWTKANDGFVYAVLNDRRLVRFANQQSGARVLASNLPGGKTIWMDCDRLAVHAVKAGCSQRPTRLLSLPLPGGPLRVLDLVSGPEVQAVYRYGDTIVAMRPHDVRAYALSDGRLLGHIPNPHRGWVRDRYFRGANNFYFAVWDGERVKFERVTMPGNWSAANVLTIFDRSGHAGPWLLDKRGQVVSADTGQIIRLPVPTEARLDFSSARISRDGHRLLLTERWQGLDRKPRICLIDLEREPASSLSRFPVVAFERSPALPAWNMYRIIESAARYEEGLALCGRKGRWRKLAIGEEGQLRIQPLPPNVEIRAELTFTGQARKTKQGCTLQEAQFPDGTRLFQDSRGLLHFKSPDPDVPEVSLVLADREVAGWTSDGYVCGSAFFFEGPYASNPERVFERLMNIIGTP